AARHQRRRRQLARRRDRRPSELSRRPHRDAVRAGGGRAADARHPRHRPSREGDRSRAAVARRSARALSRRGLAPEAREGWMRAVQRRWLVALALLVYGIALCVRRSGDFDGYLQVGGLILSGGHAYYEPPVGLNTWPPFFSVFCVPLALLAKVTPYLAR